MTLPFRNAGMYDIDNGLIAATDRRQFSWRISDHYPLWCEFTTALDT